jgi:hypothetical protein
MSRRLSRVPGPSVENIRKPSTASSRRHWAISAPGSATTCSIMLDHTSWVQAGSSAEASRWSSACQRRGDHQGAAAGACGTTPIRRAFG